MPFSWDDRVTVITGASSGIGRELALLLDKLGARLVINARREDKLRAVADQCNRPPTIIAGDITQPATQAEIIKFCRDTWDRMDVLINNAGVGAIGKFEQATPERLRQIMEVNFFAVAELTRNAIPLLKNGNDRPTIANLCSVLGHRAVPLKSEYCASKFAIHGFSDSLRAELVGDRIHVLTCQPQHHGQRVFRLPAGRCQRQKPHTGQTNESPTGCRRDDSRY